MSTLHRLAALESKIDAVLFRTKEDELQPEGAGGGLAKGAAVAGGGLYAGSVLKRGLGPLVADRKAGMRSVVPGFAKKAGLAQTAAATGSVLKDKPISAVAGIGKTVARDAGKVGRVAAMIGRESVGGLVDTFRGAGMIARDVSRPIGRRIKNLAGKLVAKA